MKTLFITITIILFSSCSSRTNVAANNCKSGIPGNCPACAFSAKSDDRKGVKFDESMALMGTLWASF